VQVDAHAFWLREPGCGEIRSVTLPEPGRDEVVVRTLRSGVSRGTETLVFRGGVPAGQLDAGVRLGELAENEAPHGRAPSSSLIPAPSCSSWFSSFTSLVATAGMNLRKTRNKVPKKQMVPKSSEKSTQVG